MYHFVFLPAVYEVPVAPNPCHYMVGSFSLILTNLKWNGCVVVSHCDLICIYLIIKGIKSLYMSLVAISIFSFVKYPDLLPNLLLSCKHSLSILRTILCLICVVNIFYQYVVFIFISLIISMEILKILVRSN